MLTVDTLKDANVKDLPAYATQGSAGLDLRANLKEPITIYPETASVLIPTGLKINMKNPDMAAMILPRSGLGHKKGLVLGNGTGLIDSDYQGELMVSVCVRAGHDEITISHGEAIAQLVFVPVLKVQLNEVVSFEEVTNRGEGGFGSTKGHSSL